jgi:hypothetical protein
MLRCSADPAMNETVTPRLCSHVEGHGWIHLEKRLFKPTRPSTAISGHWRKWFRSMTGSPLGCNHTATVLRTCPDDPTLMATRPITKVAAAFGAKASSHRCAQGSFQEKRHTFRRNTGCPQLRKGKKASELSNYPSPQMHSGSEVA